MYRIKCVFLLQMERYLTPPLSPPITAATYSTGKHVLFTS
jgi:hypothetical protein